MQEELRRLVKLRQHRTDPSLGEDHGFTVNLVVKGKTRSEARAFIDSMLGLWFMESTQGEPPFPMGALLTYNVARPTIEVDNVIDTPAGAVVRGHIGW